MTVDRARGPRSVRTLKPGDRVLRVQTRRSRLHLIERTLGSRVAGAFEVLIDISTQTPVLWMLAALVVLVALAPVPVYLFEGARNDAEMASYWVGLWWAVAAFTTAGHSNIGVFTVGGRIFASVFTIATVALFWGAVIAAFSSYFILTWRRPKRQLVNTINYYLQRIEELSVDELEELDDMTRGLLRTAKERAEAVGRHSRLPAERADAPS